MRILGGRGRPLSTWVQRLRRRLGLGLALVAMFTIVPGGLGAVAMAQDGAGGATPNRMDGIAWMDIRDSAGVQLADYTFVSERGGFLDPGTTVIWTLVGLEFVGYMVIVTTAIWFIGYALSFAWLELFAAALQGAGNAFADQLATPAVLITAASLGAFFVAWFTVRGNHVRAVVQTLTMLAVAVLGPLFLTSPLAGVLGPDGLPAQGRDLGVAVAAGLHGSAGRDPDLVLHTLQAELADNFARHPVQVWNFGHIVDDRPACAAAWSAGMAAGDAEQTRRALGACGDTAAVASARLRMGQLGTGLVLLASAAVLLLFAVVLAFRLIRAALDAIYQAFMAIFGFAAGGFVYGATQTFLVRNLVNSGIAAVRMCAYTVFVGIYLLLLGDIFRQARDQVLAVIVIAAVVEIIAVFQLGRLSRALTRGATWMTGRFALAVQGAPAGSGGSAPGAGGAGGSKGSGIAGLAALNTVNASPLTAWILGGTLSPLSPLAFGRMRNERANIASAASRLQLHQWRAVSRQNWRLLARREAGEWGGIDTELGLNRALKYLGNNRVPAGMLPAVLLDAGASHERIHRHMRARQTRDDTRFRGPYGFPPLQKAIAAGNAVLNHAGTDAEAAFAAQAVSDADSLARHTLAPGPRARLDHAFIARVQRHWDSDRALRANIAPGEWNRVGRDTRTALAHQLATEHLATARAYSAAPTAAHRGELAASLKRLSNLDHTLPEFGPDPWDL